MNEAQQPQPRRYEFGELANGHVLTQDGWIPVATGASLDASTTNGRRVLIAWVTVVLTGALCFGLFGGYGADAGLMSGMAGLWGLGYFVPWAISETNGNRRSVQVLVINAALGWTFVGWVAALVLAFNPAPSTTSTVR